MKKSFLKVMVVVVLGFSLLYGALVTSVDAENAEQATEKEASIYIAPINRAKFMEGVKFDFRVELNDLKKVPDQVSITINGQEASDFFGKAYEKTNTFKDSQEYTIKDVTFKTAGEYEVVVKADELTSMINYEVVTVNDNEKKAKNVILFVGDGMNQSVITAARIMSKGMEQGKYNGMLVMDEFLDRGVVTTSGMDSIATDSANSASAYTTGHKSVVNALGVYPSNTESSLDKPKVETIGEIMKRSGKSVGVVSTAEIEDATPASVVAHTRLRGDKQEIADMFAELQPEVIMGGGSAYFLPQSTLGSKRKDEKDLFEGFEQKGYKVVENGTQLKDVNKGNTEKLLGLFHTADMNVYYDRSTNNLPVLKSFNDQPTLWDMTDKAIDVLSQNDDGFFLMVEGGSIDKQLHPLDWERAIYDAIEMDKAIGVAKRFAELNEDTLVIVTADHSHSMSITGTYYEGDGKSGKDGVRTYADAKFPTYVDSNGDGFPDNPDVERKLAVHFGATPDYYEDYKFDPVPTSPTILGENGRYVANPGKLSNPDDPDRDRFLLTGPLNESVGVHTVDDVPLLAYGPGSDYFRGTLDNTEIFFGMLHGMGLKLNN